ncbi:MAG: two-component sensor histidine kinase [Rhodobiaceae bacterium]|nr:two-component sensor histidine kinase [Rhodobiaceae bacterium]|tara:strand:+ start:2757 stop:4076 length:1320 start_codon:yes stop_codon:yes gene_type:complete
MFISNTSKKLKKFMPEGLYSRSLLIIIIPIVILQGILTFVFLDRHWQLVTRKLSSAVASEITTFIDIEPILGIERITKLSDRLYDVDVKFFPNQKLVNNLPEPVNLVENTLGKELSKILKNNFWIDAHTYEKRVIVQIEKLNGVYEFTIPRRNVYATNSHIFLVWMVISSLLLVSVAVMFMRQQIKPIEKLSKAAQQFGLGMKMEDFKPSGASEVREAAEAYLKMQERIERFIEQRTLMLAGVSHDLRTPLTRLKLQIEMLSDDKTNKELLSDVNEMQKMLETYLDFAEDVTREKASKIDLELMIREIIKSDKRDNKKINFNKKSTPIFFECRSIAMKRCITNLINNAGSYGNEVLVSLDENKDGIIISVEDDGPGIKKEDYDQAIKPFIRLDTSRNQNIPGSGLGLSISQDITSNHGGKMSMSESSLGGLKVSLNFPK